MADDPQPKRTLADDFTWQSQDYLRQIRDAILAGGGGGGGAVNQGDPNVPSKAWPVVETDPAGVNQGAITSAGDRKVTLDGEAVAISNFPATQPVSGTVGISGTVPVSGPLTDAQLRATAVPVTTGLAPLTDTQLRASSVPVSGPATDAQLRATPLPVSGTVAVSNLPATQPISGTVSVGNFPATQPVSAASLPLPTGASTEATLALIKAKTDNLDVLLSTRTKPADTQKVDGSAVTQPISGTVAISGTVPVSGPLTDTQLRATPVPVSGTVTANIGTPGTLALDATLTGGLQKTKIAFASRVRCSIIFQAVAPAVADTLLSLVKILDGVAAGGATSIGVTGGKTLRIDEITFSLRAGAATAAFGTISLRQNPSGATVIGSQSELRVDVGNTEAVIGAARSVTVPIQNGLEFSGTQTLGISLAAQAITNIISITLSGFEYIP